MSTIFLRRAFLGLVALESLLTGLWSIFLPDGLFRLLEMSPRDVILWRGLGLLLLSHVPCLILAGWRPAVWRYLALVPLLGRALLAGLWTWLLCTDRVVLPRAPLYGLLGLELVWLPGLAWTLVPCSDSRRASA